MRRKPTQAPSRARRRPLPDPASRAWFMIFILGFCVAIMIYIDFNRRLWNAPTEAPLEGRQWGRPEAELRIIQFVDLESFEGIRGEQIILELMQKHPTETFLQTRFFPQNDRSKTIAQYAQCASLQKKMRRFLNAFNSRFQIWAGRSEITAELQLAAEDAGLDKDSIARCLRGPEAVNAVTMDRVYGESLFVRTTPTYLLNGKIFAGVVELEKALSAWDIILTQDE